MNVRGRTMLERRSRGQAMAEFAIIAPIFFLLLFSIIQLGILFGGQNGLVASARELARYAAPYRVTSFTDASNVCADTRLRTQIDAFMKQSIPGYGPANVHVPTATDPRNGRTITYTFGLNTNGSYYAQLTVLVVYDYPLYVPIVGGLIDRLDGTPDNKFTLDATETMRIENLDLPATAAAGTYNPKTCTI